MKQIPLSIATACSALFLFIGLAGCHRQSAIAPGTFQAPECVVVAGDCDVPDTIHVALPGRVALEYAPLASNPVERLLFRHLYETLVNMNCAGEVFPGLAESWTRDEDGRRWTFRLREGALFWDGTAVISRDILTGWSSLPIKLMAIIAGIDSVTVVNEQVFRVYMDSPRQKVPEILAALELAVVKRPRNSQWPIGTGSYRIAKREQRGTDPSESCITTQPVPGSDGPVFRFLETSVSDTRDRFEGAFDVMVTADPAVIDYAESRPQLVVTPLPWDMTYLLLSTSRVQELRRGGTRAEFSTDLLEALARDAVRGEARGSRPPYWWDRLGTCGDLSGSSPGPPPLPMGAYTTSGIQRILYDGDDPIAKGLAERIVALASADRTEYPPPVELDRVIPGLPGGSRKTTAEGVTWGELEQSLRSGQDFAYIVPVVRQPVDPCYEARVLVDRARWLALDPDDFADALVPLVDTRRSVITRGDRIGLSFNWNGDILFDCTGSGRR